MGFLTGKGRVIAACINGGDGGRISVTHQNALGSRVVGDKVRILPSGDVFEGLKAVCVENRLCHSP